MSADENESLNTILVGALARTIDFVKFAEAKNAALLGFSSAWSLGITAILNAHGFSRDIVVSMTLARGLFVASILLAVWSFVPRGPEVFDKKSLAKNLLYFGHAASLEVRAVKRAMESRYIAKGKITDDYLNDLGCQIAVNSRIANAKYRSFGIGAAVAMAGLVALAAPVVWAGAKLLISIL